MDLLARYLQAVRFLLPARQQDDIVRELSENLVSQMEDREEELGRPLTEDEQADILRRHGHPIVVAGRYGRHQQLIGPAFFPMYLFAMKVGLGASLLVSVVVAVVGGLVSADPVRHILQTMLRYPGIALMVFAWTTLVFAALEFAGSRLKVAGSWDPRTLPKVVRREHWISRGGAAFECLMLLAVLVWLLLIPAAPQLLFGPAARVLELAPAWAIVYVPILLITAGSAVLAAVNALLPYWTRARSLARIALQAGSLGILAVLLRAGAWVLARPGATLPDGKSLEGVVEAINVSCQIGLVVAAVLTLVEIGREMYRWRSRRQGPLPPDSAPARVTR